MHQIALKMQHTERENLKNFWGGGIAPSQTPPPLGRRTPLPKPHPSAPTAPRFSAPPPLSSFATPISHFWLWACEHADIEAGEHPQEHRDADEDRDDAGDKK